MKTLTLDLSPEEAELYRDVSEFVIRTIESGDEDVARRWYFTLVVLQKELGSSIAAARKTLEHLARQGRDRPRDEGAQGARRRAPRRSRRTTKVDALVKLLESLDDKAIVFTQFRASQDEIAAALTAEGIANEIFHGEQTWQEKEEALDRFRGPVPFLISTEAGGEGRNLQFAHIVVNYDLPWNPMRVEQRIGRVHRLGQQQRRVDLQPGRARHHRVVRARDPREEDPAVRARRRRGRGDPRALGARGLVRGRGVQDLDREQGRRARARSKYAEFAARLAAARKRYQEEQELQKALLPEERS